MTTPTDRYRQLIEHNRKAWNHYSRKRIEWSTPIGPEHIRKARNGDWSVILTPNKPVPDDWFKDLEGRKVLCLASGGGQQAPVLAAAGAHVTSFDLSEEQLDRDREVARRDNLEMEFIQGDMADLSLFNPDTFDLIFHPVSNVFVPDVTVVWKECFRVLKPGGNLLAGFMNPLFFLFDPLETERTGELTVRYRLPFAEPESLDEPARAELEKSGRPFEFGHLLEAQIGGQIAAGFQISGFYEDTWSDEATPLNGYSPLYIATRATKGC
ncbi:MAG: class I SAM-dependent methyltransferase [Gammaproteobacteria bacterium]|nr:class I SAM-dependent methyltransferase [Pseudomonadales bacterium]MCP5347997.1 class I SAM-dependent methyltransferase [Pseudomonadales bacterium]